jgi:TetR/AcrR family transcriptional regulator
VATDNPRREILAVAARLIAQHGFSATRMAAIAQESGLQQSSIYYWFRSKNEILRAIVDQNRVSLTAARALSGRPEPAAVRLYVVLYQDVVQMCSGPLDFFDLEEAARQQPEVFSDFRGDYDELVVRLREIVASGMTAGQFHQVPVAEFVRTALSLTEGSQHRFRAGSHDISDMPGFADAAAWFAVRALLADPDTVSQVRAAARSGIDGFAALVDASPPNDD